MINKKCLSKQNLNTSQNQELHDGRKIKLVIRGEEEELIYNRTCRGCNEQKQDKMEIRQ